MSRIGAGKTDIGKVRSNNEDSFFVSNERQHVLPNVYIVADGMGGHKAGEVASSKSIQFFLEYIGLVHEDTPVTEALRGAVVYANQKVYECSTEDPATEGMGTTFSVCAVIEGQLYYAHVGDSRIYIINDIEICQITEDHTFVNELIQIGKLTFEEAKTDPRRNIVTRALGTEETIKVDCGCLNLNCSDKVLICSDGLTDMLSEQDIFNCVNGRAEDGLEILIQAANDRGGLDNITAILI